VRGDDLYGENSFMSIVPPRMRRMIFFAALTIPLMAGIMFTGYWSSTHSQKVAQPKVEDVPKDLNSLQKDADAAAHLVATVEGWEPFKSGSELKISAIEIRIIELNAKMNKPGEIFDALYLTEIANLEQQSRDIMARLRAY